MSISPIYLFIQQHLESVSFHSLASILAQFKSTTFEEKKSSLIFFLLLKILIQNVD